MGAPDILTILRGKGLTLTADGGNLLASPKAALTDETRALIRAHKAALVDLVKAEDLQAAAGDDWPDIKDDPEALAALSRAISIQRLRSRGEIPPHYTGTTSCKHCGTVPIFEGCPDRVEGCPWCLAGLPLPMTLH